MCVFQCPRASSCTYNESEGGGGGKGPMRKDRKRERGREGERTQKLSKCASATIAQGQNLHRRTYSRNGYIMSEGRDRPLLHRRRRPSNSRGHFVLHDTHTCVYARSYSWRPVSSCVRERERERERSRHISVLRTHMRIPAPVLLPPICCSPHVFRCFCCVCSSPSFPTLSFFRPGGRGETP